MGQGRHHYGKCQLMPAHLLLRLEGPLVAFGGEAIDNFGVVQDFPLLSMVTGLIANALGWRRGHDAAATQRMQDRLVIAARLDRQPTRFRDFQTAQLFSTNAGWTTRGRPEGHEWNSTSWQVDSEYLRRTGTKRYTITHQRFRDMDADALCLVAIRLEPPDEAPDLPAIQKALARPERPLFLGRKPCLPSAPIVIATVDADTSHEALLRWPDLAAETSPGCCELVLCEPHLRARPRRAFWPFGDGPNAVAANGRERMVADERNWLAGPHGGGRRVVEGMITPAGGSER